MGMTRKERILHHSRQERTQAVSGRPVVGNLNEGSSVLGFRDGKLKNFVRHGGVLYESSLERSREISGSKPSTSLVSSPDYDSGWVDMPGEDSGGTLTHGIAGVNPNEGKLLDYRIYLRNALNSGTADRWILWNGDTTYTNDHFTVAFDSTTFIYHQDSDTSTVVKWGVAEGTETTAFENCSFRILAWKAFSTTVF